MNTISNNVKNELIINKSTFISLLYRVDNVSLVKDILDEVRQKYNDATHYCYGYIIDSFERASDDGEPSGTAGNPILNVLHKRKMDHILCVVVRYFGGIKLGASGLVRAYSNACIEVLNKAKVKEIVLGKKIRIMISYNQIDEVNYLLGDSKVVYKEFGEKVIYEILVKKEDINKFMQYQPQILEDCFL